MDQVRKLRLILEYDKLKYRGRGIMDNFDELGLLKGDRLEPQSNMPDIGFIDHVVDGDLPLLISFWRNGASPTGTYHRNPLISRIAFLLSRAFDGPAYLEQWSAAGGK